mgnify:CR=1 FL=1
MKGLYVRQSGKLVMAVALTLLSVSISAQVLDSPVATVRLSSTEVITQRSLKQDVQRYEEQLGRALTVEQRREVLDAKINEVLLKQGADRANVTVADSEVSEVLDQQKAQLGAAVSDEQFRRLLEQQTGMSYADVFEQIRRTLVQQRFLAESKRDVINPPGASSRLPAPSEVRKVYEENQTNFINPAMSGFTHIFFDSRNLSEQEKSELLARAQAKHDEIAGGKTSFQRAVNAAMDDSSVQAGDFGYIVRGDQQAMALLGSSFVDAVFALEEEEVSEVIESNIGYHIIKVTDKRAPRLLEMDDPIYPGQSLTVRMQIIQYLQQQKQQERFQTALQELIGELREDADITIFEERLNW